MNIVFRLRAHGERREWQTKIMLNYFMGECRTITHRPTRRSHCDFSTWKAIEMGALTELQMGIFYRKTIRKEFVRFEIETNGNLIIVNIVSVHRRELRD